METPPVTSWLSTSAPSPTSSLTIHAITSCLLKAAMALLQQCFARLRPAPECNTRLRWFLSLDWPPHPAPFSAIHFYCRNPWPCGLSSELQLHLHLLPLHILVWQVLPFLVPVSPNVPLTSLEDSFCSLDVQGYMVSGGRNCLCIQFYENMHKYFS